MKLLAISDLHMRYGENRRALEALPPHPDDWLIVAGDVCETQADLEWTLRLFADRFQQVIWVPGNHELWTIRGDQPVLRGPVRYQRLVEICRSLGVLTPEDPFPTWPGEPACVLAPLFVLYDYSFHPDEVAEGGELAWAIESGVLCADEALLHPDPFPSRTAWCHARCELSEQRLGQLPSEARTILINHFPLRRELAVLPAIPRFSIWCGTRRTEDWHLRFRASVVVSGHLHIRSTRWRDGVRFEEVSLGNPGQWRPERGLEGYLREILPGPTEPVEQRYIP